MANIMEELLNAGTIPPEQLVELLREQKEVGLAGALSGSKRFGAIGAAHAKQADDIAATLGENKSADELHRWRTEMAAISKRDEIAQRARDNAANRANQRHIQGMRGSQARGLAGYKAKLKGGAGGDPAALLDSAKEKLDKISDLADVAMNAQKQSSGWATGIMSHTGFLGGTPASKLNATIEPLMSNEALSRLEELRENARAMGQTGSGLGQVTEREIALLKGSQRNLELAQGEEQLDAALKYIEKQYRESMRKIQIEIDKLEASGVRNAGGGGMGFEGADDEYDFSHLDDPEGSEYEDNYDE